MKSRFWVLTLAAAALVAAFTLSSALGVLGFVREWKPPSGAGEPVLVAIDRAGTSIYLSQGFVGPAGRVIRYDRDGNIVRIIEAPAVDLDRPLGVAVDSTGLLYVFEGPRNRVAVVNPAGGVVRTIAPTGMDTLDDLASAVAVDRQDNLYIADTRNSRILVIGAGTANVIRRIPLGGGFVNGVAVDATGNVYALIILGDGGCQGRVQKHAPGGALLTQWAVTAPPSYSCARQGVAVDPLTGEVLVSTADGTARGVRRYAPDGTLVGAAITGNGSPGSTLSGGGLALADNGDMVVADTGEHRVLLFQEGFVPPTPPPPPPPPPPSPPPPSARPPLPELPAVLCPTAATPWTGVWALGRGGTLRLLQTGATVTGRFEGPGSVSPVSGRVSARPGVLSHLDLDVGGPVLAGLDLTDVRTFRFTAGGASQPTDTGRLQGCATLNALPPAANLATTIPSPQTVTAGPTSAIAPGTISLASLKRSKCIRVIVQSRRPARVLATIFSGRKSIRLFGQKDVLFLAPGSKIVCIPVPFNARTFNVRTPLSFALGYRLGTLPELKRPATKAAASRAKPPVIKRIKLVP